MTYPVFASGDVLNASDMNGVGLWLVKSQAVGSGVSSVTVSNCFTADYENYKVVYSGGVASTIGDVRLTMDNATASWYGVLTYGVFNANTVFGLGTNNLGLYPYCGSYDTSFVSVNMDVQQPYSTAYATVCAGQFQGQTSMGFFNARHAVQARQTGITLAASSGTFNGGTVSVYGYRK
jgi:hypothetical protein